MGEKTLICSGLVNKESVKDSKKGLKYDAGKVDYSLIPFEIIEDSLAEGNDQLKVVMSWVHDVINDEVTVCSDSFLKTLQTCIFLLGLDSMAIALMYGEVKYSRNNWKDGFEGDYKRFLKAFLRHSIAYCNGKEYDGEAIEHFPKGNLHKGACCFCMLLAYNEACYHFTNERAWEN